MADACNCLQCQADKMIAAEVERRAAKIDCTEIVSLAVHLLSAGMAGLTADQRRVMSLSAGMALAARLKEIDAITAGGIAPTHEPEARVQ